VVKKLLNDDIISAEHLTAYPEQTLQGLNMLAAKELFKGEYYEAE